MTQQAKVGGGPRSNGHARPSVTVPTPWSAVQFRQLATLAAVADAGSFQGAAQVLGYTPSAVSQHISALERAFGARLVVRANSRERVRTTPIGRVVLTHWERVAGELRATAAELSSVAAGASGTLTVVPPPSAQFEWVELYRDPFVLVVPSDSALARKRTPLAQTELARLPLLCFRDCPGTEQALAALTVGGTSPRLGFRADYSVVLQALVRAGRGFALIPRKTFTPDPAVAAVEVGEAVPARVSAVAWRSDRERSPLAQLFVDAAKRVCATANPT